jgi:hypothetical protein
MIWLALIFVWFSLTVLRGAREKFAWGALWLAFFVVATLHVFNPDDYIVRTNIRLMQQGRQFDAKYNSGLSSDAVPVLLENLSAMTFENQCRIKLNLSRRFQEKQQETDFRNWNFSRWRAQNLLTYNAEIANTIGCPDDTKNLNKTD